MRITTIRTAAKMSKAPPTPTPTPIPIFLSLLSDASSSVGPVAGVLAVVEDTGVAEDMDGVVSGLESVVMSSSGVGRAVVALSVVGGSVSGDAVVSVVSGDDSVVSGDDDSVVSAAVETGGSVVTARANSGINNSGRAH